ncbi:response regulator transcription factor [Clostridium oryzae]|uniref:Stage 0 sporulation protein A homolog n=1 Tax=Clostridium oryzae TaxID=1450648 RepID=A0A1V4IC78_9CLOT|nr:response regulator transcription factor [Clostridium oryzae]OPJ57539.1 transcriptional regulatory protein SrrA [Clostridium oryzae]
MSKSVLIVEDEVRMRILIKDYLKRENYLIYEAGNGLDAIKIFNNNKIDLIILDIMMPFMDGWEVCKNIRQKSRVPIIMLTAKAEEDDKLLGYELGADDYVTKPFSVKILVAKIKAVFNRIDSANSAEQSIIEVDGLKINELSHEVILDENEIILSPKEYELLLYLIKNKGIALSRTQILDSVWGIDYYGDARTVDTNIKRLREKLGEKSYLIATVRGSGYRFEVRK